MLVNVRVQVLVQLKLAEKIAELKEWIRHPKVWVEVIEQKSTWLNRQLMGAASVFIEPFLLGRGFYVDKIQEDAVEITMPGGKSNQGAGGAVHAAALTALGEFTARLFWERHLDRRSTDLQLKVVNLRMLVAPIGEMRAVFRLPIAERESILHQLRATAGIPQEIESDILVYDRNGLLVAEIQVKLEARQHLALKQGK